MNNEDGNNIVIQHLPLKTKGINNPRYDVKVSPIQIQKGLHTKMANGNIRKVEMIDIETDETIKTFNSAAEADRYLKDEGLANKETKQLHGIRTCCKNLQKTAYGYKWRYIS